jgi:hypothetical protein
LYMIGAPFGVNEQPVIEGRQYIRFEERKRRDGVSICGRVKQFLVFRYYI